MPDNKPDSSRLSIEEILNLITDLTETNTKTGKQFLKSDWVVLSGGEALLDAMSCRVIAEFAKGRGHKVKLNTNGTFPLALSVLSNDNLIDYVAIDFKTAIADYDKVFGRSLFKYEKDCFMEDYRSTLSVLRTRFENACEVNTVLVNQLINETSIVDMALYLNSAFGHNGFYPVWNLNKYESGKDLPSIDPTYNTSTSLMLPDRMKHIAGVARSYYRGKVELHK